MDKLFDYHRHPRAAELKKSKPVTAADTRGVDHENPFVRFNARFGLVITVLVGSMWCAYLFTAVAFIALPDAIHDGPYYIIVWLSSSFLQLVLLPIIIVGQNIQGRTSDKRAEETYKDAEAVLHEAAEIQRHLEAQDAVITTILERLERLTPAS